MTQDQSDNQSGKQSNQDNEGKDDAFVSSVVTTLEQSAGSIDASIMSRLNQARQKALEHHPVNRANKRGGFFNWFQWLGAGTVTAMAVVFTSWLTVQNVAKNNQHQFDAVEVFAAEESMEFYENLHFYQWLAKQKKLKAKSRNAG